MKKILIPYDFTENSNNVLNFALGMAKDLQLGMVLMHVIAYPVMSPEVGLTTFSYTDADKEILEDLKKMAERLKKENPSVNDIECFSEMGDISDSIVSYGKKNQSDFIMMSVSGYGSAFFKSMLGSNAVSVSHKIQNPLIIVPPNTSYKKPRSIALASPYSENNEPSPALPKAKEIAALFNADLELMHVVPEGKHINSSEMIVDDYTSHKLENSVHKLFIITEKKVSEGLLGMIQNRLIDMILVEPKVHGVFYKLFHESVTKELAFKSPIPVMTIHHSS
jgi:nucleotide-binding universal stress UspA family protein